jgi:serine phosphatase RsbU (regulator of sigma subunit)
LDEIAQLAALARVLKQLLLASYGLYPEDLSRELADAARHLGGEDVVLLLSDYDQHELIGFDWDDGRTYPIDGPGPGAAFRQETVVEEVADDGRRRLWLAVKDSAERLGVFGLVDDGTVPHEHWEAVSSLVGELVMSKSKYGDHVTLRKRKSPFSLPAEMRWGLLPPLTFTAPDVAVAGFLQPSHGIAGDAFDYGVTGRTASVAVFDAMGHGMEASRMANVAVASYRNTRRAGLDPAASMAALDEVIASEFGDFRFVTAQIASLDLDTGVIAIANAGHPPPVLLRKAKEPEVIDCPPTRPAGLGCEPSLTSVQLQHGDRVLFCTDGVVDARSPDGEWFGEDRLAAVIAEIAREDLPPSEVLRRAMQPVVAHAAGRAGDHATLLLVSWNGPTSS